MPARILLQDLTGVPLVVDLASLRSAAARAGNDPSQINPLIPVDLVIDHSIQVDFVGSSQALAAKYSPGVFPQPGTIPVPEMGAEFDQKLPGHSTCFRDRPPGEPGIPGAGSHYF